MQKIEVSQEWYDAAMRLAEYVESAEYEHYVDYLEEDGNPEDHIYTVATFVSETM